MSLVSRKRKERYHGFTIITTENTTCAQLQRWMLPCRFEISFFLACCGRQQIWCRCRPSFSSSCGRNALAFCNVCNHCKSMLQSWLCHDHRLWCRCCAKDRPSKDGASCFASDRYRTSGLGASSSRCPCTRPRILEHINPWICGRKSSRFSSRAQSVTGASRTKPPTTCVSFTYTERNPFWILDEENRVIKIPYDTLRCHPLHGSALPGITSWRFVGFYHNLQDLHAITMHPFHSRHILSLESPSWPWYKLHCSSKGSRRPI